MLGVVDEARVLAGEAHAAWSESFNELFAQVAGEFRNAAVRRHGRAYLLGLLSQTERKNGWALAEFAGDVSPDGLQRLLNFSPWDEGGCRDAVRRFAVRHLGDPGAVVAVDETGFLKKGRMSAGVARQYTGTAGRVENCQVGVFLAYAAPDGSRAVIDREVYLPEKWTGDRDRCRSAGIGDEVAFATKPQLAEKMIGRAVEAGAPFAWVTGDEGYGGNPGLRSWLEGEGIANGMAGGCGETVTPPGGRVQPDRRGAPPGRKGFLDTWGKRAAPPRTYAPPPFITDETGRDLIPLTAAEARRLFNLHTRIIRPEAFHEDWSGWRRYRQASARKSHYARRTRHHEALL